MQHYCSVQCRQARTGRQSGTVKDDEGHAIANALVSRSPSGKSIHTNTQGKYFLEDLSPVTYTVTASASGYVTEKKEAEWEFAARGGNKSKGYIFSGSNTIGDVAWYTTNSGSKTHPVKTKATNELGIYDMSGNVREWCSDWYGTYSSSAQTDPTGPATGTDRVNRGGSWFSAATYCRCAYRYHNAPSNRYNGLGFRLAL